MYKSPIEVYVNDMLNQIRQQEENQIVAEVSQAVGINVEKEELIKALNYDRNQYEKGYEDGKRASKWIPCSERLPEEDETEVLITLKEDGSVLQATYLDDRTFDTEAYGWFAIKDISAWMLLPKPYEESEETYEKNN